MEHQTHILLVGEKIDITSLQDNTINILRCNTAQEALEMHLEKMINLIICNFELPDKSALELHQLLQQFLQLYPQSSKQDTKLLVITSTPEQEKQCIESNILHMPSQSDLKSVLSTINLKPTKDITQPKPLPINFEELFIRVDNNTAFIKQVMNKFLTEYASRIEELRNTNTQEAFQNTKDTAHKLKGVLANFSMEESYKTILEIEQSALSHDKEKTKILIDKLEQQIEKAETYFHEHKHLFEK